MSNLCSGRPGLDIFAMFAIIIFRSPTVIYSSLFLRPFQVVFGVLFAMFGFVIFLSLLLTNVDKAINSDGPFSGYSLQVLTNLFKCAESMKRIDKILPVPVVII
jgi:hypothetical protein